MSVTLLEDLRQFREFLSQKLESQPEGPSPEDVLKQWRAAHPLSDELAASSAEIQQALDEMPLSVGVSACDASAACWPFVDQAKLR